MAHRVIPVRFTFLPRLVELGVPAVNGALVVNDALGTISDLVASEAFVARTAPARSSRAWRIVSPGSAEPGSTEHNSGEQGCAAV